MLAVVVLGTFLAAQPAPPLQAAPPAERLDVLVLDIEPNALGDALAATATELVAQVLGRLPGLTVTSGADLRRALELESTRAAMGCDQVSCLAEIAGALGASLVVFGQGGQLAEAPFLQLSVFDTETGRNVGRRTIAFESENHLAHLLEPHVLDLVRGELVRRGLEVPPSSYPVLARERSVPALTWTGLVVGSVALGVGAAHLSLIPWIYLTSAENAFDLSRSEEIYRSPGSTDEARRVALLQARDYQSVQALTAVGYYTLWVITALGGVVGVGALAGAGWALLVAEPEETITAGVLDPASSNGAQE